MQVPVQAQQLQRNLEMSHCDFCINRQKPHTLQEVSGSCTEFLKTCILYSNFLDHGSIGTSKSPLKTQNAVKVDTSVVSLVHLPLGHLQHLPIYNTLFRSM